MRQALLLLTLPLVALSACKKEGAADQPKSPAEVAQ